MKTGIAFGDHIKTEKITRRKFTEEPVALRMRGFLLPLILIFAAFILFLRLGYLQLVQGKFYQTLADSNRIRSLALHAPRGIISDRNGTPLVLNMPGFRQIVGGKSIHISKEEAYSLAVKGKVDIEVDSLRQYPLKDALAHVLGYMGQITADELKTPEFANYSANDWVGKTGIEKEYEQTLRGQDGQVLFEVDAMGRKVRALGQTDPIPGQDISLTIDAKLQKAVYDAAKGIQKGAVIVSLPDGELLAMVSKPSFDPNLFTLDSSYKPASDSAYRSLEGILTDSSGEPILNRAISGTYPPGSTFKIINAAEGLESHKIDENFRLTDTGILKIGDFSFANWYYTQYGRTEPGQLDITRAIARSNDIFFYKTAEMEGIDNLSNMAKEFGLGKQLGVDLPEEVAGLVPTKEWKKAHLHEDWFLGDTYHYGIGQGYLLTTPLQVNSWTQVIANGGTLYQPRLLLNQKSKIKNHNFLSEKTISLIRQGMIGACSTGGVAWPLFNFKLVNLHSKYQIDGRNFYIPKDATNSAKTNEIGVTLACKTGTAEHGSGDTLPHAWITLFAPAYDPQIVITVLSESSGEGSNVAAPVAKKILESYFGG